MDGYWEEDLELEIEELNEDIAELKEENKKLKELLEICRNLIGDESLQAEIDYEIGAGR